MSYVMTNKKLADVALGIVKNNKTLYVNGAWGAPLNDANKKRYTNDNNKSRWALIAQASDDTFGFDCVCLIKSILWGWNGDVTAKNGGAKYASNGVPDVGENRMIAMCADVSSDFSNIEVGEMLWLDGHAGIYVGNGFAVESTTRWSCGVQKTAILNIGAVSGYNGRYWTKHGKLPWVDYAKNQNGGTASTPAMKKKSIEELANEVIAGKWGSGEERKKRLTEAGYDYREVQDKVNEILRPKDNAYKVKVVITNLNLRKGPGTNYAKSGMVKPGTYTIIEEKNGFGKAKELNAWFSLKYAKKI